VWGNFSFEVTVSPISSSAADAGRIARELITRTPVVTNDNRGRL